MWKLAFWMADGIGGFGQMPMHTLSRVEIAARGQFVNCFYPGPRKFRDIASALKILVEFGRPKQRHSHECRRRYQNSARLVWRNAHDIGRAARR